MKWLCTICNYVEEGEEAPEKCPVCGAGRDAFVPVSSEGGKEPVTGGDLDTLEGVRDAARSKMKGVCAVYPWCDGAAGNVCNREAYGGAIGMGGAGTGSSFRANVESIGRLRLRTRVVGEALEVDSTWDFFGERLSMPVMASSTSGISGYGVMDEEEFNRAVVKGCVAAGTIGWRGDTHFYDVGGHGGVEAIRGVEGKGVQIFKPRKQDVLKRLVAEAQEAGCLAVGVDLDGCGSTNFARAGKPVFRKGVAEIRELVAGCSVPFVAKGIMCAEDAEACVEAGVQVVAVSNHGGRVLDYTPGVAEVLPSVVERVEGNKGVMVTMDGGVRTGYDVLKMLALGADAVLVGRDVIRAAIGGGAEGVRMQMERMGEVLRRGMLMTGCRDLGDIDARVLEPLLEPLPG